MVMTNISVLREWVSNCDVGNIAIILNKCEMYIFYLFETKKKFWNGKEV